MAGSTPRRGYYKAGGGSRGIYGADEAQDVDLSVNNNLDLIDAVTGIPDISTFSNFPGSPQLNDLCSVSGIIYKYNGITWKPWIGDGTSGITFAGTVANFGTNDRTSLQRTAGVCTLNIAVNVGANALAQGGIVIGLPTDYAAASTQTYWFGIDVLDGNNALVGRALCYINGASMTFFNYNQNGSTAASTNLPANYKLLGQITYRAI